ncbi:TlpA disulfide reductase family protein [Apibacter sp. B2912]|uniref:TlpA disulfide reductase family protein n=1 Tax=Apibacter sp. B2912 TaxID=2656763 RepID=UPI001370DEA1|nr:redoxin family protein [Apibacter sp. B2912]MXO32571.1 redoxin family protein [Apibacter sp. B2912]
MKKIYVVLFSLALLVSCKEKNTGKEQSSKQTHETTVDHSEIEVSNQETKIIKSDFSKIQSLLNTKSDTIYITNYWATWCPPCVKEIPDFVALQEKYTHEKVKFIFVSIDQIDTQSTLQSFVQKNKMKNVYNISSQEMRDHIGTISPDLEGGIPVTVIQKGNKKEGFLGNLSKEFILSKIEEYSK